MIIGIHNNASEVRDHGNIDVLPSNNQVNNQIDQEEIKEEIKEEPAIPMQSIAHVDKEEEIGVEGPADALDPQFADDAEVSKPEPDSHSEDLSNGSLAVEQHSFEMEQ